MVGLFVFAVIVMWLLGMITPAAISAHLPMLAVIAVVVLLIRVVSGRHAY
jgi:hypothetical protein